MVQAEARVADPEMADRDWAHQTAQDFENPDQCTPVSKLTILKHFSE